MSKVTSSPGDARPARRHFVTFLSPGTFVHETSSRPIDSWDTLRAVEIAEGIRERYGARPFGFQFETQILGGPIPDGEGGELEVLGKTVKKSGIYFIDAKIETLWDIERRADPKEQILIANMRGNGWPVVAVTQRGYKSVNPFEAGCFVVDAKGAVTESGDAPKWALLRERLRVEETR